MESPLSGPAGSATPADSPLAGSPGTPDPAAVEKEWDQRYSVSAELWSGQPNAVLVSDSADLRPGRALDVGCGEGADALWLAEQGWEVTALDVSQVALARAARQAEQRSVRVNWLHSGLVEAQLPPASFDLVSAQYPVLLRTADGAAGRALLRAVAPGGTLLMVHHPLPTEEEARSHGFNLLDYVGLADIAALLNGDWRIEANETRPRHVAGGAGAHHTEDVVLRARRLR